MSAGQAATNVDSKMSDDAKKGASGSGASASGSGSHNIYKTFHHLSSESPTKYSFVPSMTEMWVSQVDIDDIIYLPNVKTTASGEISVTVSRNGKERCSICDYVTFINNSEDDFEGCESVEIGLLKPNEYRVVKKMIFSPLSGLAKVAFILQN